MSDEYRGYGKQFTEAERLRFEKRVRDLQEAILDGDVAKAQEASGILRFADAAPEQEIYSCGIPSHAHLSVVDAVKCNRNPGIDISNVPDSLEAMLRD